ncbi:MAG: DUF5063 domain-containing protein [Phycisphaerae bacterium]
MTPEQREHLDRFAAEAKEFCRFIDSLGAQDQASRSEEPYHDLHRMLSKMAATAVDIPWGQSPEGSRSVDRPGYDGWQDLMGKLAEAFEPELEQAKRLERDDVDPDLAHRMFTLADDIADIYNDLRYGLQLYWLDNEAAVDDAAWQWRWSYESHWGEHMFRALQSMHEMIYGPYIVIEDEED